MSERNVEFHAIHEQARANRSTIFSVVVQRHARERAKEVDLCRLHPIVATETRRAGYAYACDALEMGAGRTWYVVMLPLEVERLRIVDLPELDAVETVSCRRHDLSRQTMRV